MSINSPIAEVLVIVVQLNIDILVFFNRTSNRPLEGLVKKYVLIFTVYNLGVM